MASSKKTIIQDGRRKYAEDRNARPARAEGASGRRKPSRDGFRDNNHKPEKTDWENPFKKSGGIDARQTLTALTDL